MQERKSKKACKGRGRKEGKKEREKVREKWEGGDLLLVVTADQRCYE